MKKAQDILPKIQTNQEKHKAFKGEADNVQPFFPSLLESKFPDVQAAAIPYSKAIHLYPAEWPVQDVKRGQMRTRNHNLLLGTSP